MLSYQHIYHAGNFADVYKHAILAQVFKSLRAKPAPMMALDTHAGRGVYDLSSDEAEKNREFENGIVHFMEAQSPLLRPFLDIVKKLNPDGHIRRYPGSAALAREMLRPADRLICCEKHPGEFEELQKALGGAAHTFLKHEDGFDALVKSVPFKEHRGIAIIDPSYEIKSEYATLPKHLLSAWRKWRQGCYFIWYPIMDTGAHNQMLKDLNASGISDILIGEIRLEVPPQSHFRMTGSGIAIVNPPWPETVLKDITHAVVTHLPTKAAGDVFWLNDPEKGFSAP